MAKRLLTVAFAALTSAVALGPSPAFAQAAYAPALSKPFRDAMAVATTAGDVASLDAAAALATLPDEKYVVGVARYDRAKRLNNKRDALIAIEAMLASGSPLLTNKADLIRTGGSLSFELSDAKRSVFYLTGEQAAGNTDAQRTLMGAEALVRLKRYPEALTQFELAVTQAGAGGSKAPEAWYYRAISVARTVNNTAEQARIGAALIRAYPTVVNWRTVLLNYQDGARLGPDARFDLERLLYATGALTGEGDYLDYADLAGERGASAEAQTVLAAGVANRIVESSSAGAKTRIAQAATRAKAARTKEAAAAKKSTGTSAKEQADSLLARGENAAAVSAYRTALSRGGVNGDEINTRIGIALARAGDKAGAQAAFSAVSGSQAELARFWLLWLETQV